MEEVRKRHRRGLLLEAQHQLRQPLNALSLLIGELRQGPSGRDLEAIAEDMRHALQLSNVWLDALSDLEAAERDQLELEPVPVTLQPVLARLAADFAPRFAERGLSLRLVRTVAVVRADPRHLRRVLAALLDNALKFTPRGKVLLGCRRAGRALRLELHDSGPGIDPAAAARVFEPFFRLDNEVRPRERGLGLGLPYARRLAELAGDSLSLTTRPGRGCCFALTLQRADRAAEATGGESPGCGLALNPLEGVEVLVLEGPEAAVLSASLAAWGAAVRPVGADGLAGAITARPRLLIADRSAFEAAGGWHLKGAAEIPTVLVSERAPDLPDPAGCATHSLLRPVRPSRLRALCHFVLTQARRPTRSTSKG